MSPISEGQEHVLSDIRILGTNTIDIYPGKDWGDEKAKTIHTLTPADADAIAQQGHIDSVTPMVSKSASVRFGISQERWEWRSPSR